MARRKEPKQVDKYCTDVLDQYVPILKSKNEMRAVIACYAYVSKVPNIYEGPGQNIFFLSHPFNCYAKSRRLESIRGFIREVGFTGVNEWEFKRLLKGGLPLCNITIKCFEDGIKRDFTLENTAPVLLRKETDPDTGELIREEIFVLGYDPIMHDYYSSLRYDVTSRLQELTTRELKLGLKLVNYHRQNRKRLRGTVLVLNLSRDNVDRVLQIDTGVKPSQRDHIRDTALQNCKGIELINGYKHFLGNEIYIPTSPNVVLASVEDFGDVNKTELLLAQRKRNPAMVTLIFNNQSF